MLLHQGLCDVLVNVLVICPALQGYDVTQHVLACFGGAGGQHACAIAKALGIRSIFIHRYSGILSAVGIGLAEVVQEAQVSLGKNSFALPAWSVGSCRECRWVCANSLGCVVFVGCVWGAARHAFYVRFCWLRGRHSWRCVVSKW